MTISKLSRPNIFKFLGLVGIDWAVVAGAMALSLKFQNVGVWIISCLVIGTRQHALAIMGHDGAHGSVSRNRKLNDLISSLTVFWCLGIEIKSYREFHFDHHKHLGTSNDPESSYFKRASQEWEVPTSAKKLFVLIVKDLLGLNFKHFLWIYQVTGPNTLRRALFPAFFVGLLSILVFSAWGFLPIVLWFVSFITSFIASNRLRMWLEHKGTTGTHRVRLPFWLSELITPHWAFYHYEHHKWPSVPCWNLSEVAHLDSSVAPMNVVECFEFLKGTQKKLDKVA